MSKIVEGDVIQLVDRKRRRYQFRVQRGAQFSFHRGAVPHDKLIGLEEGNVVTSSHGERLFVFKPTLAEFVLKMQRGAQIIYPKDIAAILMFADIFPGARVLEAGTGSAALTLALLRAVGEHGVVISYEIRKDFLEVAKRNIEVFFGNIPENLILRERNIYEGLVEEDKNLDRMILDLPEPWRVVKHAKASLRNGGILIAYNPSILQIFKLSKRLEKSGGFLLTDIHEVALRGWESGKRSIRPKHRMVAHTGFLLIARRLSDAETETGENV
ncbi:MAG TPA: tRNA (adenine-N1)-methyltransferase [Candidatus Syntrophoarchaeum butanivorans]|uniref:tRNA (Adenine-N1)-methyltransferase n=1 Tax=Candidatus Syntropharchaeum butanivorans TaxID=1839936 RepID=A0A7J2S2M5_9EURY|nr:tRNA (adenine-N1)-methyltransferase [Candidatus Syntrophoarchaeum butanivorans]